MCYRTPLDVIEKKKLWLNNVKCNFFNIVFFETHVIQKEKRLPQKQKPFTDYLLQDLSRIRTDVL